MVSLTSLNNLFAYMNNFQKSNSSSEVFSTNYTSYQFQKLAEKFQQQSLPDNVGFRSDVNKLKTSSQDILSNNKNAKVNSKAVQSDSKAIIGTALNGAAKKSYAVKINQLATAQKNSSSNLLTDEKTTLGAGDYSLKLTSQGKTKSVNFNVEEGDTNKEVLDKIAKAINNQDNGATAKVVVDEKSKTSRLEISSTETGTDQAFELEDFAGNAGETLGIANVSVKAQDAKFTVNGEEKVSKTNEVKLDYNKVSLQLKEVTDKEVQVSITEDKTAIKDSINSFVDNFNKVINDINNGSQSEDNVRFAKQIKKLEVGQEQALNRIGISIQDDGRLEVDQDKLEKAISENPSNVKKVLGGYESIASKSQKFADNASKGVYELVSNANINSDLSYYYKTGTKALYSQNLSRGIFVDMNL